VSDLEDDANDVDKNSTADDRDGVDATDMSVMKLSTLQSAIIKYFPLFFCRFATQEPSYVSSDYLALFLRT